MACGLLKFEHLLNENVFDFVERTKELLAIEKKDDITLLEEAYSNFTLRQLEEKGLCLRRIQITDIYTGLYGRTMIKFALHSNDERKTEGINHKFTVGDIVKFVDNDKISGVICKSFRNQLKIAINDGVSFEIGKDLVIWHKYSLLLLIDSITYTKYKQILSVLCKPNIGIATPIRDLLFSAIQPATNNKLAIECKTSIDFQAVNKKLNASQLNAIQCALDAKDIFLIHGPPGTGKTTTIIELMYQSLIKWQCCSHSKKKMKILACAPSNIAVDNMVEKLSSLLYKDLINIVRIGHPARISDNVLSKCLESLLRGKHFKNDDKCLVDDIRQEIKENLNLLNKVGSKKERYLVYAELKALRKELKKYETKMVDNILNNVDVILCTLCGADRFELKRFEFDLCIIDEAAQSLEVACWIPMVKSRKIVLCGDHLQLAPTVKSTKARELSYTLFDKLQRKFQGSHPPKIALLDTQYRMNQKICQYFSDSLYESKLKSHESVAQHLLSHLPYIGNVVSHCLLTPLMLVDCAGIYGFEEDKVEPHVSKSNMNEAQIVAKHVDILLNAGVKSQDIAVISPYRGQVTLLREFIKNELIEVGTVDGFQGREKEAVIVSFVRSNDEHIIGFLSDDRRTNVAITRARRHCCLFLNSETLERHTFLKDFTDFCYKTADIRTADQYLVDDLGVIDEFEFVEDIDIDLVVEHGAEGKKLDLCNEKKPIKKLKKGMNRAQKKKWRKKVKLEKKENHITFVADADSQSDSSSNDAEIYTDKKDEICNLEISIKEENKKNKKNLKNIRYIKVKKKKKKKKQKQNGNQNDAVPLEKVERKKDDLLNILVDVNAKRCFFKGCKKKVHLLKIQCKFCARIFCVGHGPAIFHSEQCEKQQKYKNQQKRKQSLKEIETMQYNEKNNIKLLKPGQRTQLAKRLRQKIEKKQKKRVQKSVRNKKKRNGHKKKMPRKK